MSPFADWMPMQFFSFFLLEIDIVLIEWPAYNPASSLDNMRINAGISALEGTPTFRMAESIWICGCSMVTSHGERHHLIAGSKQHDRMCWNRSISILWGILQFAPAQSLGWLARFLAREACAMQRWPIWLHLLEVPIALCITRRVPRTELGWFWWNDQVENGWICSEADAKFLGRVILINYNDHRYHRWCFFWWKNHQTFQVGLVNWIQIQPVSFFLWETYYIYMIGGLVGWVQVCIGIREFLHMTPWRMTSCHGDSFPMLDVIDSMNRSQLPQWLKTIDDHWPHHDIM